MSIVLIFMVVAFTFSLAPTIYHHVYTYLYNEHYNENAAFVSVIILTTNSVWNFVIYNVLNKKFRASFINLFFKLK